MTAACHYAIVRFTPFIETGEFANVGVVIFSPDARYFGFKLLSSDFTRVTDFFRTLDAKVVKSTMSSLRDELERLSNLMSQPGTPNRSGIWTELIKPRETMLRFSDSRLVLAQDCQSKLIELYDYYVDHEKARIR
ncbi:DUF3037 domain-containing protein [Duganella aquatilis]|jgi:hypothetical protein|nr:DUF3037 domain-containing protein [Duganella aquatilis]